MAEVAQVAVDIEDSAEKRVIALFGTGADFRLSEKLSGVINAEPAPATASEALCRRYGYLGFSARTGEIGNLTGLRLLFAAAFAGVEAPAWQRTDGRFVDPLRPHVEPGGLASAQEMQQLQARHLQAVRRALSEADEVILVLGGAPHGRDKVSGAVFTTVPDMTFPRDFCDQIEPCFADFDAMDADFTEIWRLLNEARPGVRINVALAPPTLGATPSRAQQQQLACLRVLADEWAWRFAGVRYLPLWDAALAGRGGADGALWARAEALLAPSASPASPASAAADPGDDDEAADTAPRDDDAPAGRADRRARRAKKRKGEAAPSTVCEDELLEAFSR